MALHDLRCPQCGSLESDVKCRPPDIPLCPVCGIKRVVSYENWKTVPTDIWGQSRYFVSLDKNFDNVSDLRSYCKQEGISQRGDKVHGARNQYKFGTKYSFPSGTGGAR